MLFAWIHAASSTDLAVNYGGVSMETFGILGFVFGLLAFLRTEKLIKNLKQQGVLDENYKAD